MKTAADFLDDLRAKFGLTSDYQLSKLLGMERQQVGRYRRGRSTFDDRTAARMAEMLGVDPGYVAACMNAQRAQTDQARRMWEKAAKTLAGTALLTLAGCTLLLGSDPSAFDITQCFALFLGYLPVPTIHYANYPALAGLLLACFAVWTLAQHRTCSARSR